MLTRSLIQERLYLRSYSVIMRVRIPRKAFIIPIAKFFFLFEFVSILKKFYVVISVYQHPLLNSMRILVHMKKEFLLSFRDGKRISVDSIKTFYSLALKENALILQSKIKRYEYAGREIKLYCVDPLGPQIEVFQKEEYKFLEVKMKKVLDVGANIGDTSLYFLFKSASKVIAVEPYPANCKFIEKNIDINNIDKDKIIILNAGVGVRSKTKIPVEIINSGASESIDSANGKDINIVPLLDLINKYELTPSLRILISSGVDITSQCHKLFYVYVRDKFRRRIRNCETTKSQLLYQ